MFRTLRLLAQISLAIGAGIAIALKQRRQMTLATANVGGSAPSQGDAQRRELQRVLELPLLKLASASAAPIQLGGPMNLRGMRENDIQRDGEPGLFERYLSGAISLYLVGAAILVLIVGAALYSSMSSQNSSRVAGAAANGTLDLHEVASDPPDANSASAADLLLDSRRKLDLGQIRDALHAYATFFAGYPTTAGVMTTFCAQPRDAGCAVASRWRSLSVSDGKFPYWYQSDGTTYTLLSQVQEWPDVDDCPEQLPAGTGDAAVFCVTGTLHKR